MVMVIVLARLLIANLTLFSKTTKYTYTKSDIPDKHYKKNSKFATFHILLLFLCLG